jgi:hypothetical protein
MFGPNHPVLGFYHAPPVWVDAAPYTPNGTIDSARVNERVYRNTLRSGIGVSVHRCGTFYFDFATYPPSVLPPTVDRTDVNAVFNENKALANRRVMLLNAFLACLYQAYDSQPTLPFFKMTILPSTLLKRDSLDGTWLSINDTRLLDILSRPASVSWDEATRRAQTITLDVLVEAFDLFSDLLDHPYPDTPMLVDLFLRSVVGNENDEYTVGLLMAWAVVEKLLNRMWGRYVSNTPEQHVRSSLQPKWSARNYPEVVTAAMIEVLMRERKISADLEAYLTIARNARNAWMHDLATVGRQDAAQAKHAAEEMLQIVEGISFNLSMMSNHVY